MVRYVSGVFSAHCGHVVKNCHMLAVAPYLQDSTVHFESFFWAIRKIKCHVKYISLLNVSLWPLKFSNWHLFLKLKIGGQAVEIFLGWILTLLRECSQLFICLFVWWADPHSCDVTDCAAWHPLCEIVGVFNKYLCIHSSLQLCDWVKEMTVCEVFSA